MSPRSFAPDFPVVCPFHVLKQEQAIRQRQRPQDDRCHDGHNEGNSRRRDEYPVLHAVDVDERGNDTGDGVQRAGAAGSS